LGFGPSSNRGAEAARGRYLVFLNNDTEVQPGWLAALLGTFQRDEEAGLVGVRLVYPDGSLQEAGGQTFPDGSAANCGRGQDPEAPPYRYLREVDYCSAACIMVPRSLFRSLGGFDPAYGRAYYEDTDLAFKVRQAGRRVYYQPQALVLHHEGASAGRDPGDPRSVKHGQEINRTIFRTRWAAELEERDRRGPGKDPDHLGETQRRILFVDDTMLTPDRDSGSLRAFRLLQLIREEGFHPIFCPRNLKGRRPYLEALEQEGVECWHTPHIESVAEYLRRYGRSLDLVMLSRFEVARMLMPEVRRLAGPVPVVFDTV
ncbi:glycosyltransferase, partial [mine drainage metagenome]